MLYSVHGITVLCYPQCVIMIILYPLKVSNSFNQIQWTLTYPATTGPDHGQISEIAGYVNHHASNVYNHY